MITYSEIRMRALLVGLLLSVGACGGSTEPGLAGDPSILVTNDLPSEWVYVNWKDGQGILGRDSVAARTVKCVRFLAQPDSAYWEAFATVNGYTNTVQSPEWFNPEDRPAWTLTVRTGPGAVPVADLAQAETDVMC